MSNIAPDIAFYMQLFRRLLALVPMFLIASLAPLSTPGDTNKAASKPAEQKFHAILVWATDDDKPAEKEEELKAIEPGLKERIKFLKWKNYFQVGERKRVSIRPAETKEIQLSHKCKLKLHETEKEGLQVELIGEGIPVIKKNQSMPLKDILIIGGDDTNATAWMVVLMPE